MSNLRGLLESISITDVVQLLHLNRKTGQLLMQNGRFQGVMYVSGGAVVHAETSRSTGESAAFELLAWERGEFEFQAVPVKPVGSIRRSVPDLLMESARTLDTRRRLGAYFPSLDAVPWTFLPEPALTAGLKLTPEALKAIAHFDGYQDFHQVMTSTQLNETAVLEAAFALLEAERLQVFEPAVPLALETMKTGLFKKGDHVELGVIHESRWRGLQPYSHGFITQVRVQWRGGVAHEAVRFVPGLADGVISVPEPLLKSWGIGPTETVVVRPAP